MSAKAERVALAKTDSAAPSRVPVCPALADATGPLEREANRVAAAVAGGRGRQRPAAPARCIDNRVSPRLCCTTWTSSCASSLRPPVVSGR